MRKILAIAWNDIKMELSDRWTLVFFLALPLVFTTIIGLALRGRDPNADSRLALAAVDQDNAELSAEFKTILSSSSVIRVEFMSAEQADQQFEDEKVAAVLTIPENFTQDLYLSKLVTLGLKERPENSNTPVIEQAVQACANQLNAAIAIASQSVTAANQVKPFASKNSQQNYWLKSLERARQLLVDPPTSAKTTHPAAAIQVHADGFKQSSPGQLVTWVLITLLGGSYVFVNERLEGTLRRLAITPTSRFAIMSGKILGVLAQGLLQMLILVGFGALVLGVNWGRDPGALAVLLVCFGLAGTTLGVMLGAFARTRAQANGLTILFSMLLAALGGAWWPLEITPPLYQSVVKIFPSTWAMSGLTDVIVFGKGLAQVWPAAVILLAFAAVFCAVGVWKLRRLEG